MAKVSAHASIQVCVQIPVGTWDAQATFESLNEQVKREGLQILRDLLKQKQGVIVGEPTMRIVMINEEGK
jgi:hypothetical protein